MHRPRRRLAPATDDRLHAGIPLALALADSPLRICLIDRHPHGAWADDPRALEAMQQALALRAERDWRLHTD